MKLSGTVIRGVLKGEVWEDKNRFTIRLYHGGRLVKTSEPYEDQDEAEVEIPAMIDAYTDELRSRQKPGLVRR